MQQLFSLKLVRSDYQWSLQHWNIKEDSEGMLVMRFLILQTGTHLSGYEKSVMNRSWPDTQLEEVVIMAQWRRWSFLRGSGGHLTNAKSTTAREGVRQPFSISNRLPLLDFATSFQVLRLALSEKLHAWYHEVRGPLWGEISARVYCLVPVCRSETYPVAPQIPWREQVR